MRWIITGGTGFVGSNLISSLLAREDGADHQFVVLDNFSGSSFEEFTDAAPLDTAVLAEAGPAAWQAARPIAVVRGDIRDADLALRVCAGADVVVHLAANTGVGPSVEDPRADCEANVIGTLNMLEAARAAGVRRFVFASSGAPAGICEPPITELIAPRPASPYGASKLAGEGYCSAYSVAFGLPTVALRFSNVYGPRSWRKGSVVATFIRQVLAGKPITINGDGTQTRDFVYIGDLVEAIRLGATVPDLRGEIYQIATGVETSVNQLLEALSTHFAAAGLARPEITHGVRGPADVLRNYADASKAREQLGWRGQTPLSEGLKKTLQWFLDREQPAAAAAQRS